MSRGLWWRRDGRRRVALLQRIHVLFFVPRCLTRRRRWLRWKLPSRQGRYHGDRSWCTRICLNRVELRQGWGWWFKNCRLSCWCHRSIKCWIRVRRSRAGRITLLGAERLSSLCGEIRRWDAARRLQNRRASKAKVDRWRLTGTAYLHSRQKQELAQSLCRGWRYY